MTWPAINIDLSGTTITNSLSVTGPSASASTGDTNVTVGSGNSFSFSPNASFTWPGLGFSGTVTPTGSTSGGSASSSSTAAPTSVSASTYYATTTIDATSGSGVISLYGPTVNINSLNAIPSATNVGNSNEGSTVTLQGGNSGASFSNNGAYMGVLNGGGFSAGANSASMGVGNYGFTSYGTPQQLTQSGVPVGSYANSIQGDTLINGSMYVNGKLDFVSADSASTMVKSSSADGSILGNGTGSNVSGQMQIVSKGATDSAGNVASQASASLTLTNGLGNTHGLQVYEDHTVLSGGTQSTSMTLNDNSVSFSNTATGGPVQLKGVADGTSDFDAVNYRQLKGMENSLSRGVAMAAALAGIPQVDQGKTFSVGLGAGTFNGQSAVSLGGSFRFRQSAVAKIGISKSSGDTTTGSAGVGFSW